MARRVPEASYGSYGDRPTPFPVVPAGPCPARPEAWFPAFPTCRRLPRCDDSTMPPDVLVVDDDPTFRALAVRLLQRAGLRVTGEADSVRRAMEVALDIQPGAVLLDV